MQTTISMRTLCSLLGLKGYDRVNMFALVALNDFWKHIPSVDYEIG